MNYAHCYKEWEWGEEKAGRKGGEKGREEGEGKKGKEEGGGGERERGRAGEDREEGRKGGEEGEGRRGERKEKGGRNEEAWEVRGRESWQTCEISGDKVFLPVKVCNPCTQHLLHYHLQAEGAKL